MMIRPQKKIRLLFFLLIIFASRTIAIAQSEVQKTNPMPVYMHYMPWFDTPQSDGSWGWHWTMNNRNPDNILNPETGRRDIASHYYPMIGPYASNDPHVCEYHLLLMKLSGIDGILIDWYGQYGTNPDIGNLLRNSNAVIDKTDDVGIEFGLILEDRFAGSQNDVKQNMSYARDNYFSKPEYFRYGNGDDPVVGIFGPISYEQEAQWTDILSGGGEEIEFLPLWGEAGDAGVNSDGEYVWIWEDEALDNYYTHMESYYQNQAPAFKTVMGVAYPGFEDFYIEGGVHESYFDIPHNNGNTLDQILGLVDQYKNDIDILQLATWNDYGEGTIFEPTWETGYSYLTRIQTYTGVVYDEDDLRSVYRFYTLRKAYLGDVEKQGQLDQVLIRFANLELEQAVALMDCIEFQTNCNGCDPVAGLNIYPTSLNLGISQTFQVEETVLPASACNKNVSWSSADPSVATVDQNGVVTSVSEGLTVITISAEEDPSVSTICTVTVSDFSSVGTEVFRIKNRWQNTYLYDDGATVGYSALSNMQDPLYLWHFEPVENDQIEIKNSQTGHYMHIENMQGTVACTERVSGWSSAFWQTTSATDPEYVFIEPVQEPGQGIHLENLSGSAEYGTVFPEWQSAQWLLEQESIGAEVIQIEGEDYVEMSGVSTEACTDQGGGQNVAEIDGIDWMKYENITISTSGYYTFVYRVSSLNGNAQFTPRLNNEDLDVLTIGATNGWQQWVSVSQSIYLESGSQVLEVYSNSSGWNLNWIQIIPEQLITNVDDMTAERGWHVVPNPAHDELRLIQEGISETVSSVVAIDMRGMKTELTFNHSRVDISMLKKGLYTLVWQVNNQVRTQSFVKKQ